jgi:CheY-like chemotaxis protein
MTQQVILHVEDDDASYAVFSEVFKDICPEMRLERARDGVEALVTIQILVRDPAIDLRLILLDVFLPMMGGWEVLDAIRKVELLKELPVVMFTNLVRERDRARCIALGVDYLEKPTDLRALIALVKEICARAELSQPAMTES